MRSPIYHYNDFGENYEDGGMYYGRHRGFANLNPYEEADFLTLIGETCILVLSENKEDIKILMSFLIIFLFLTGVMMLSQPYFRSKKLISCLIWNIFP